MNIKPLGLNVLIKRTIISNKTFCGIILSANTTEAPFEGNIIAVGEEVTTVTEGDRVIFDQFAGTPITHNGVEYTMMKIDDLLARIS